MAATPPSERMPSFLDAVAAAGRPALWLDYSDYAGRLLAGGAIPWLDVAAFVAWQRKAQSLLKSNVAAMPIAPAIEAWLAAHDSLREAMAEKSRAVYPLRTLLADESLRAHLLELTQGLRSGSGELPLALVLPSPRAWVALAYRQARGESVEVGEDEADSASVYIADFLRVFDKAGVDVLLLQEAADYAPTSAQDLLCYQSVINVAAHYRWEMGLHIMNADQYSGALPDGCAFAIAERALDGVRSGVSLGETFWKGAAAPAGAQFFHAQIPADAQPESVLERLAALR